MPKKSGETRVSHSVSIGLNQKSFLNDNPDVKLQLNDQARKWIDKEIQKKQLQKKER
jgi:hypothetical protein